ncbi:acyltransferase family protein [Nocardiopsis sp. LOL_012]|uniref:acyltransferase family protein n=1 Tax=Nocardiopsis sp. LOL_012 TaxID=3345409 RepID=UPI003A88B684
MTTTVRRPGTGGGPSALPAAVSASVPQVGAPGRDRFLDVLRLLVMGLVVLQHWWLPVLTRQPGELAATSVIGVDGGSTLTWFVQVMPLIFFVGGASNLLSWRSASGRGSTATAWVARRLRRIAWPVVPVAAVWIGAAHLLSVGGVPEQPVSVAAEAAGMVLWFLAVYVLVVVATPVLAAADARIGPWAAVALFAAAGLTDAARIATGSDTAGYANVVFVWLGLHQLGFLYARGALRARQGAVLVAAGAATVGVLALTGLYSPNMTGVFAMEASNVFPPNLVLASVGALQIGAAVLLRSWISAWADRPGPARVLDLLCPRLMTVYLWHMIPVSVVSGTLVYGLGVDTPQPMTVSWLLFGALGTAALTPLVVLTASLTARFEEPPRLLAGDPGPILVLASAALIGGGLGALTGIGLGVGWRPLLALAAVAAGLLLMNAPRLRRVRPVG